MATITKLLSKGKMVRSFGCRHAAFHYREHFSTNTEITENHDYYFSNFQDWNNLKEALHAIDKQADYICLLQDCIAKKALAEGKFIHAHITESGLKPNKVLENTLLNMYAKCGSVTDARRVFDGILEKDGVSWNVMISCYAKYGPHREALELFHEMKRKGIQPSAFVFASVLPAFAKSGCVQRCKEIHQEIFQRGLQSDVFVSNALLDMHAKTGNLQDAGDVFDKMPQRSLISWNVMISGYAKSGRIEEAVDLFRRIPQRDVVSWTAMIVGCTQNGYGEEALEIYGQMRLSGVSPNSKTFSSLASACADLSALQYGKEIHAEIMSSGSWRSVPVCNALVDMYAKCGSIDAARRAFDKVAKDVVSWNTIISGYLHNGHVEEAEKLFQRMPDRNAVSWTAMIAGYAQNGYGEESLKLFQQMRSTGVKPNAKTFASVLPACASLVDQEKGREIHEEIKQGGFESDVFVGSALVDMYAKCGSMGNARDVFDRLHEPSMISWTAIVAGYAQNGEGEEAIEIFRRMQVEGVRANSTTFASILPACANLCALEQGRHIHGKIIRTGCHSNVFVGTALIDMYAKCGRLQDARKIFDNMSEQNVVSWNAIVAGYAINGFGMDAIKLFEQIQAKIINPNRVTFLGVLSACCHSGLLEESLYYFDLMNRCYHVEPSMEHYGCMVDLLGRAGFLDEACVFIVKMPMKPKPSVWGSLLGACRIHKHLELGEHVANYLFESDSTDVANYVQLSNIYAAVGRWDDIQHIRKMMNDKRLEKKPGCSWIEVDKHVHIFVAGDNSRL